MLNTKPDQEAVELTTYKAADRRVYNGALCSDMAREFAHTEYLEARLEKASPLASCTYFPAEGKHLVFVKSCSTGVPLELTGNFHENRQDAIVEAIRILEKRGQQP
jgi:hypothetical protein